MIGPDAEHAPQNAPPHLVVKLRRGWRYDTRTGRLVSISGQHLAPREQLGRDVRVAPMVPHLLDTDPQSLSQDERNLIRYVHLILPKRSDVQRYMKIVRDWPCVEEVQPPPDISLPD